VKVLKEYLIGTGGWAYFQIPRMNPLAAYSRAFNFVEVNTTFYEIPKTEEVEKWRQLVPIDFQFSVRAHRSITHKNKLAPVAETFETFEKMRQVCNTLKAEILHLQTPPSLKITHETIANLRNLIGSVNIGKLRLALEIRSTHQLPLETVRFMQENGIVHCVDLSKGEEPAYESDILYTRLFGKGKHNIYQPTDEELAEIDKRILFSKATKASASIHFLKMYKDAARLKVFKRTGKFPPITKSTGLTSLEEVLSEDARFPSSKHELIENQGWKLFDQTQEERIHTADVLQKLPEKNYKSIADVISTLKPIMET
jgi:uncharacterized protein YecE (DUF72 family)